MIKRLLIFLLPCFFLSVKLFGQVSKIDPIDLGICNIDLLNAEGFNALKEKFENKRIIIIGEQQHGVGTGYENFAHFVKFLHEEMGFNLIAQEYCFFSFGESNKHFQNGGSAQEFRKGMYLPQGNSIEMNLLLDYLDKQKEDHKKIFMEGFDSRISYIRLCYYHLDSVITNSKIKFSESEQYRKYLARLKKALRNEYKDTITDAEANLFLMQTDTIIMQLKKTNVEPRDTQLLRSLKGFVKNSWNINHINENDFPLMRYHEREKQMFDNLTWLLEVAYPGEKFIVLTHNAHAAKNVFELDGNIPYELSKNALTLGDLLHQKYGDQCLHIATTHFEGTYCSFNYKPIPVPTPNLASIETTLYNKGYSYAYADLNPVRDSSFYMYHFNFNDFTENAEINARFGQIYDGVIFIKTAKAATARTQASDSKDWLLEQKLPAWALENFKELKLGSSYSVSNNIDPFYLEADFNGDSLLDIAISIIQKTTGKKGILILHGGGKEYFVCGAGTTLGRGGNNFAWMDVWKVCRETFLKPGFGETETVRLKGNGIFVENHLVANAVIYWTGKEYKWYHQDGF